MKKLNGFTIVVPRRPVQGGTLLAGTGRAGVHHDRRRPSAKVQRQRFNVARNRGNWQD